MSVETFEQQTYYELFDVPKEADADTLKRAYYKKVRQYPNETHPEHFIYLRKAYETLSDPTLKEVYDMAIEGKERYQSVEERSESTSRTTRTKEEDRTLEQFERATYYERLNVASNASSAEIKRAFYRLVRTYPHEHYPEHFMLLREAYEVLSEETRRAQYDAVLRGDVLSEEERERMYRIFDEAHDAFEEEEYEQAYALLHDLYVQYPTEAIVFHHYTEFLWQLDEETALERYETLFYNEIPRVEEGHLYILARYIVRAGQTESIAHFERRMQEIVAHVQLNDAQLEEFALFLQHYDDGHWITSADIYSLYAQLLRQLKRHRHHDVAEQIIASFEEKAMHAPEQPVQSQASETSTTSEYSLFETIIFTLMMSVFFTPIVGIIAGVIVHIYEIPVVTRIKQIVGCLFQLIITLIVLYVLFAIIFG